MGIALALVASVASGAVITGRLRALAGQPEPVKRLRAALQGYEYLDSLGVVFQRSEYDCGPAAMKMALDRYGVSVSLGALEGEMLDNPRGTTVARMELVARRWGLSAEGRRIGIADMSKLPLPMIALYERRHYVVVAERQSGGRLIVLDPALGRCSVREAQFLRACHGEVLVLDSPRRNVAVQTRSCSRTPAREP